MPDPLHCTVFLFLSLLVAGVGQTFWMRSAFSHRFNGAIDRGYTLRNKPIFGENKTWRGFVFMIPATGMSFLIVNVFMQIVLVDQLHLWPITFADYFLLGCWTGLGFMIIELPNSFAKRQLNIDPGKPAESKRVRRICFIVDQIDSIAGGLFAIWMFVSIPLSSAVSLLILGGVAHYIFNVVLKHLGLRTRAA
jgi:hypothetical protein